MTRPPLSLTVAVTVLALQLSASASRASAGETVATVAVFPVENLSGGSVPGDGIRQVLMDRLSVAGIRVLGSEALETFLTRHRVRYTAGIDTATAGLLRDELGVHRVVFASVELSSPTVPPKVALLARLVSIDTSPTVVWADGVGITGDDAPSILGLGLVEDHGRLLSKALTRVGDSLLAHLGAAAPGPAPKTHDKFRPKAVYRRLAIEPGRTYSVAVVPFFNLSGRRHAGEILALLYVEQLSRLPQFRVADTGVVRQQLLDARIIMDGGVSISDAELVASLVEADFVLAGRVLAYQDYDGPEGSARVEFSTTLIDRHSRKVVWSSDSYNHGRDGVLFFERGTSRTAHAMATQMVGLTARMMADGSK